MGWQRFLLGGLALLARVGVLGTLAALGAHSLRPESTPKPLQAVIANAADRNQLEPASACLLLAVLVASAAVPVLAGLDFARTLADDRGLSRAVRKALALLQQIQQSCENGSVVNRGISAGPIRVPQRSKENKRRRAGDLLDD